MDRETDTGHAADAIAAALQPLRDQGIHMMHWIAHDTFFVKIAKPGHKPMVFKIKPEKSEF